MDQRDGTLAALQGLDIGTYNLNVSVSDGKFTSTQAARVTVNLVTDNQLEHALIVRIAKVTPEHFIMSYRKTFTKIIKNLFNVRIKDVEILGIQPTFTGSRSRREQRTGQPNIELLLAVVQDSTSYFSRTQLRMALGDKMDSVGAQLGLKMLGVEEDHCTNSSCQHGKCRDVVLMAEAQIISVTTDMASLVFPQFHRDTVCDCKNGFSGEKCHQILNECHREPCPSFKNCVPDSSPEGYSCQCPPGLTGTHCSINIANCKDRKCSVVNPLTFSGRSYSQYSLKRSVERHLSLSLGFRTKYKVATIMYAEGQVDYSILEITGGFLQYRFNFGSGEGLVRLLDKVVSDGEWHEVKLERHGNSAEISVDGKWRVHGAAPGHNDVLNLEQSDVFFGAAVKDIATFNDFTISRGFVGCMDDIQIDHVPVPLHIKGDSQVAKLKRFTNIDFKCDVELVEPGACGAAPCQNGGICAELPTPLGYACTCPGRFSGASCEYDLDPCASSPCLHGAKCVNLKNDFHCECPTQLSGKRCHYGRYCNPNPCQNGGVCEEGAFGPICKCRGFTGEFCTIDVNECLHQNPCHNGGTCINSPGGFTCICRSNSTGLYCSDDGLVSLARRRYALTLEEVVGIILSLFIIVIIVALFVLCRKFREKNRHGNQNLLIQNEFDKEHIMMKPRNGNHKMNNLSVGQDLPLLPQGGRPPSISPSLSNHETHFNYMDTVRSYGSAADELETLHRPAIRHRELPNDYIQNIQKPVATVAPSIHGDRDMNLKDNYFMRRKSPPIDLTRPSSNASSAALYRPSKLQVNLPTEGEETCHSELSVEEDCQRYHWDCSDWASQGLQPMMEMPNGEIIANTSWVTGGAARVVPPVPQGPVDPSRDIDTLPEGEDDDGAASVQDSEGESQLGAVYPDSDPRSPMHQTNKSIEELMLVNDMNYADEDNESVEIPNIYDYPLHLNNYLPTYHLGSDPDTDEATPMMGRHPFPFPQGVTSPDQASPRYATLGQHGPALAQDPEALARKGGAVRGRVKPSLTANGMGTLGPMGPLGRSGDKLCDLEDEEEEDDKSKDNGAMSRVTRV
jgi:protocadherin Fat 1/2/3